MGKRKFESESSKKKKKERQEKPAQSLAGSINRIPTEMDAINFNSQFSTQMANKVMIEKIEKGSNIVLSPLSFQLMLSLIAVGSKGHTLEQILSHLGSNNIDQLNELSSHIINFTLKCTYDRKEGPLLAFGNGVWVDKRFRLKPSFETVAKDAYKAKAKEVDFKTKAGRVREKINLWVKKVTKGLITDILPSGSVDSRTALVLANALYFKGEWDREFNKDLTENKTFHLMDGKTVKVPFMTRKARPKGYSVYWDGPLEKERFPYKQSDGYKILSLPYKKGQDATRHFSMYIFLPDENDGLPKLMLKINSDPNFLNQDFKLYSVEIDHLWIPRFKFSFEFEASKTIKEMGIDLPFMENVADFSEMVDSCGSDKLYVSNMFHKSFIEVNEKGTEAAAATVCTINFLCHTISPPLSFVADHPFMFMIREEFSRVVLFTGAVMNPL